MKYAELAAMQPNEHVQDAQLFAGMSPKTLSVHKVPREHPEDTDAIPVVITWCGITIALAVAKSTETGDVQWLDM